MYTGEGVAKRVDTLFFKSSKERILDKITILKQITSNVLVYLEMNQALYAPDDTRSYNGFLSIFLKNFLRKQILEAHNFISENCPATKNPSRFNPTPFLEELDKKIYQKQLRISKNEQKILEKTRLTNDKNVDFTTRIALNDEINRLKKENADLQKKTEEKIANKVNRFVKSLFLNILEAYEPRVKGLAYFAILLTKPKSNFKINQEETTAIKEGKEEEENVSHFDDASSVTSYNSQTSSGKSSNFSGNSSLSEPKFRSDVSNDDSIDEDQINEITGLLQQEERYSIPDPNLVKNKGFEATSTHDDIQKFLLKFFSKEILTSITEYAEKKIKYQYFTRKQSKLIKNIAQWQTITEDFSKALIQSFLHNEVFTEYANKKDAITNFLKKIETDVQSLAATSENVSEQRMENQYKLNFELSLLSPDFVNIDEKINQIDNLLRTIESNKIELDLDVNAIVTKLYKRDRDITDITKLTKSDLKSPRFADMASDVSRGYTLRKLVETYESFKIYLTEFRKFLINNKAELSSYRNLSQASEGIRQKQRHEHIHEAALDLVNLVVSLGFTNLVDDGNSSIIADNLKKLIDELNSPEQLKTSIEELFGTFLDRLYLIAPQKLDSNSNIFFDINQRKDFLNIFLISEHAEVNFRVILFLINTILNNLMLPLELVDINLLLKNATVEFDDVVKKSPKIEANLAKKITKNVKKLKNELSKEQMQLYEDVIYKKNKKPSTAEHPSHSTPTTQDSSNETKKKEDDKDDGKRNEKDFGLNMRY